MDGHPVTRDPTTISIEMSDLPTDPPPYTEVDKTNRQAASSNTAHSQQTASVHSTKKKKKHQPATEKPKTGFDNYGSEFNDPNGIVLLKHVRVANDLSHPNDFSVQLSSEDERQDNTSAGVCSSQLETSATDFYSNQQPDDISFRKEPFDNYTIMKQKYMTGSIRSKTSDQAVQWNGYDPQSPEVIVEQPFCQDKTKPVQPEKSTVQISADVLDIDRTLVFVPHMVLSCIAFWCCGCLLGGIGFCLAVAGSIKASKGKMKESKKLRIASLIMSLLGVITGLIVVTTVVVLALSKVI